jgi:hypothetical protein
MGLVGDKFKVPSLRINPAEQSQLSKVPVSNPIFGGHCWLKVCEVIKPDKISHIKYFVFIKSNEGE